MIKGALSLSISQAVLLLTGFFLHLYLGRTFGPEQYGIFGIINAFIMINELVLMKGVYDTLSKFVAENEESASGIVGIMFRVAAIGGLSVGILYFLCARQIALLMNDPGLTEYLKIFSFLVPFSLLSAVYLGAMNGQRKFGIQSWIISAYGVVRIPIVVILVVFGFSVQGVIIGLMIAGIIKYAAARLCYRPTGDAGYAEEKKVLRFALQLTVVSLISALVINIDLLAVKALIGGNRETGLYTAAVNIAKMPSFLIFPVTVVAFPVISKTISEHDMKNTRENIFQALRLILVLILPISLIIMATGRECISLLYGREYGEASGALNMLMLGGIFLSVKGLMFTVIIASGHPSYIIRLAGLSLLIEVATLAFLVKGSGIAGAAAASTLTHFFGFLVSYLYVAKRFMDGFVTASMIRIVIGSVVVYFLASLVPFSGLPLLACYVLLYAAFLAMMIVVKEITRNDLRQLNVLGGKAT